MEDPETTLRELELLRELGVKISIDDFGTGYSFKSHQNGNINVMAGAI